MFTFVRTIILTALDASPFNYGTLPWLDISESPLILFPSSILKLSYPVAGLSPKYGSPRTWNESSPKPRLSKLT